MAIIGAAKSPAVRSQVTNLINQYNGDPYYAGNDGGSKSGKDRLLSAVEDACKIAGSNDAAELGSEFHGLWDIVNSGGTPSLVQPHLERPLETYKLATRKIRFLGGEIVIVNDELKRAGSFDHLMAIPKGAIGPDGSPLDEDWVVVGDGKTGRWDAKYPAGVTAQLATYGLGSIYDQDANERLPIHENLNTDWGVLIHFPLAEKGPEVGLYWIDLKVGLAAAKLNNRLDDMIKWFASKDGKPIPFTIP